MLLLLLLLLLLLPLLLSLLLSLLLLLLLSTSWVMMSYQLNSPPIDMYTLLLQFKGDAAITVSSFFAVTTRTVVSVFLKLFGVLIILYGIFYERKFDASCRDMTDYITIT